MFATSSLKLSSSPYCFSASQINFMVSVLHASVFVSLTGWCYGWLGSFVCVPDCHHGSNCYLSSHLIYYLFNAFRIFHFNLASNAFMLVLLLGIAFIYLILGFLLLTPCYVISLLCNVLQMTMVYIMVGIPLGMAYSHYHT